MSSLLRGYVVKREEILATHRIVEYRVPRKGDMFMTVKNHGGECGIATATHNMRYVVVPILVPR